MTKLTIYVVHHRPEYLRIISDGRIAAFGDHRPADTLIGVEIAFGLLRIVAT